MPARGKHKEANIWYTEIFERIVYWILIALVFLLPVTIFPFEDDVFALPKATVLRLLFLAAAASWVIFVFRQKRLVYKRTPLEVPLAVFFIFLVVSTAFSFNPITSFFVDSYERHENFFTWLAYIGLFLLVAQGLKRKEYARQILEAMVIASGLVSLYAIAQQLGLDFLDLDVKGFAKYQSVSTFGNVIYLGGYLCLIIPITLGMVVSETKRGKKILFVVLAFLATLSLVFTFSRGAWVGFLSALLAFLLLMAIRGLRNTAYRRTLKAVLVTVLVLIVLAVSISQLLPWTSGLVAQRFKALITLERGGAGRLDIWDSTMGLLSERPLLGWGLNTFKDVFPYNKQELGKATLIDRPHNQTLSIAYTGGALLLLAYLWLIISFFLFARKALGAAKENNEYFLISGLLAAAFGYIAHEQFFFSLVGVTPLFWTIVGLTVVIGSSAARECELKLSLSSFWRGFVTVTAVLLALVLALVSVGLVFANYFHSRGLLSENKNDFLQAARYQLTAITLNPWESRYKFSYGQDLESYSMVTSDSDYAREAIPVYEAGLRLNPLDYDLRFALGKTYYTISFLDKSRDYSMAKASLKRSIELRPLVSEPYMWLGLAYLQEGDCSQGVRYLEIVRDQGGTQYGDIPVLFALAQGYYELGRVNEAKKLLKEVLKLDPNYSDAKELLEQLERGKPKM